MQQRCEKNILFDDLLRHISLGNVVMKHPIRNATTHDDDRCLEWGISGAGGAA